MQFVAEISDMWGTAECDIALKHILPNKAYPVLQAKPATLLAQ